MAKKEKQTAPAEKIALYEKLIATTPELERKGDTIPYTSHNGNMFSYLSKDGVMALRLDEKTREEFIKKHKAKLMEAYGIVQKEYVAVPDALLKKTSELKKYLAKSYAYVQTLKAKPTKKK